MDSCLHHCGYELEWYQIAYIALVTIAVYDLLRWGLEGTVDMFKSIRNRWRKFQERHYDQPIEGASEEVEDDPWPTTGRAKPYTGIEDFLFEDIKPNDRLPCGDCGGEGVWTDMDKGECGYCQGCEGRGYIKKFVPDKPAVIILEGELIDGRTH